MKSEMIHQTLSPTPTMHPDPQNPAEERVAKLRRNPRRLWSLFWSLAQPFWRFAPGAKANFLWVIFLGLVRSALTVVFSYISRDFWTALQQKDVTGFWNQITMYAIVLITALPILVWYAYARDRLSLRWRKWHTEKVLGDYFAKRNFYEIDQQKTVDNPDQRIAEDISTFTTTALELFMTIFLSVIDLVNFSFILLSIYANLLLLLLAYSALGTLVAVLIGKRLINLNFKQLQKEADFRYSLIRVRENAESIAFYNGEAREKAEGTRRFDAAFLNKIDLLVWTRNLSFFTTTYSYVIQILPLCVIAPLYFAGNIELGVVSQAQQAFRHILDDLSLIVDNFNALSAFSAGVDRLGELEEFIYHRFAEAEDLAVARAIESDDDSEEQDSDPTISEFVQDELRDNSEDALFAHAYGRTDAIRRFRALRKKGLQNDEGETDLLNAEDGLKPIFVKTRVAAEEDADITVDNLTIMTPDRLHRVLFEDLSFNLRRDQRLLIVGPSGTGKSSALRALAGLWNHGRGTITRPKLGTMFFLPQKPYCTLGSLREQLVYPTPVSESDATDEDLESALKLVSLSELPSRVGGFEELRDWSTVLSLGEQQRLAFARLIIGQPSIAILDECSSALDITLEDRLYSHLRQSGMGYISVGHRPSLIKYHDLILRLSPGGSSCTLEEVTDQTEA